MARPKKATEQGASADAAGFDRCRVGIEAHYAATGTIPSIAGLAALWGYASKSSAARRVDQLIAAGVLRWSADRRLAPGAAFRPAPLGPEELAPAGADEACADDPLDAAFEAWSQGYDPLLARSYSITTRLLRIARAIDQGIARVAAREGLTSGDVLLLDALYRVGPPHRIAPTALKRYFLISLAGVAKRVDRLEGLGFIRKVPNSDDRRGLFIELTDKGRTALSRLVEADKTAPHIIWPNALPEAEYRALQVSLSHAEHLIGAVDPIDSNDRS